MKRTFKAVDYDQALDLTVRLGDCLPPDHLARFVVDSMAQLDLSALYAHYGTRGGEPYANVSASKVVSVPRTETTLLEFFLAGGLLELSLAPM